MMPKYIQTFHGRAQAQFQKQQAQWFQICSLSHRQFCNCGDWIDHLSKYQRRRQKCLQGIEGGDTGEGLSFVTEDGEGGTDTADRSGEGGTGGDVR
ncbi:ORF2 [Giant panda anellovirus]|uniref:ORF2 n=1 Tax=Giant panda anellovirus TaxID=2016460 RepID=A0A220IGI4_9VIRU|nr:ORF2 [Giant panda anellovirus]ASH99103.1 ORF2 [Giant panda anellovirus]